MSNPLNPASVLTLTSDKEAVDEFLRKRGRQMPAQALSVMRLQAAPGQRMTVEQLKEAAGVTDQTIKILIDKELVSVVEPDEARRSLSLRTFGTDFQIQELPGDKRDYHDMLHALLKVLGMHSGSEEARIALAQWTRGIWETEAGALVLADVERQLKLNGQEDLKTLWKWYDRLPTEGGTVTASQPQEPNKGNFVRFDQPSTPKGNFEGWPKMLVQAVQSKADVYICQIEGLPTVGFIKAEECRPGWVYLHLTEESAMSLADDHGDVADWVIEVPISGIRWIYRLFNEMVEE